MKNQCLTIALIIAASTLPGYCQTEVSGDVNGNWDLDGSPYQVIGDLEVTDDEELVIEPGVRVVFTGPYHLLVSGTLTATGDADDMILFTADDETWRGIKLFNNHPDNILSYCIVELSEAPGEYDQENSRGGAIYCSGCDVTITNCTFRDNYAGGEGGAIYFLDSNPTVTNNVFQFNRSGANAGALRYRNSNGVFLNNVVADNNTIEWCGGGLFLGHSSSPRVENSVFIGNSSSTQWGSGVYLEYSSNPEMVSNLICRNEQGGVFLGASCQVEVFLNNTVADNNGRTGILLYQNCLLEAVNCIIYGNSTSTYISGSTVRASYCDIEDAEQGIEIGDGVIDEDPQFVDPDNGDYHLTYDSPCRDAGDPDSPEDPDGTIADMGCFPYIIPYELSSVPDSLSFQYLAYEQSTDAVLQIICESEIEDAPEVFLTIEILRGGSWLELDTTEAYLAVNDTLAVTVTALAHEGSDLGARHGVILITPDENEDLALNIPVSAFVIPGWGAVEGRVMDAQSGRGVPDATVCLTGIPHQTTTDDFGLFGFGRIPAWDYHTTLNVPSFIPYTARLNLQPNQVARPTVKLRYAACQVSPSEFIVDLPPDSEITTPLEISNPGSGDLNYRVSRRFPSYDDSSAWAKLLEVNAGELTGDNRLQGIEFAEDNFFVTGGNNAEGVGKVYQFSRDGEYLGSFDQFRESAWGMRDLAWDGELLWGGDGDIIYAFTSEGELRQHFFGPLEFNRAIAWDSERELLWMGNLDDDLYAVNSDGEVQRHFANDDGLQITGLAFYPQDPDGFKLYALCRVENGVALQKMSTATGEWKFIRDIPADEGLSAGGLAVTHDWSGRSWSLVGMLLGDAAGADRFDVWHIPRRLSVEPWTLRRNLATTELTGDSLLYGVEFGNDAFYLTGGNNGAGRGKVYVISRDGELLRSFDQFRDSQFGMRDLAWDGGLLWGGDNYTIYGFSTDGDLEESFQGPLPVNRCFTWDDDYGVLWVCDTRSDIFGIDLDGAVVESIPSHANVIVRGLATWQDDPDGYTLYALASTAVRNLQIYRINPGTDEWDYVLTYDMGGDCTPEGACITSRWDPIATVFAGVISQQAGARPEDDDPDYLTVWQVSDRTDWVTLEETSGSIRRHSRVEVPVAFSTEALPVGMELEATLEVTHDGRGETATIPVFMRVVEPTATNEMTVTPTVFRLLPAFPNPFNDQTRLQFDLDRSGWVTMKLLDIGGRRVRTIMSGEMAAGSYPLSVDGAGLPGGIYLVKLQQGDRQAWGKVVLVK